MSTVLAKKKQAATKQAQDDTASNLVQDAFRSFRDEMRLSMIERDYEMLLVLAALLCNEHVCLVGPPGTGKTMALDAVVAWLHSSNYKALLHKYIVPEELVGPVSIVQLKQDIYERILAGRAADCEVLFLDEIFKGSPAILNTLLSLLNERRIFNGTGQVQCPLKLCVAASNEWPGEGSTGAELSALFDRFLFRKNVNAIRSESGIEALCFGNLPDPVPSSQLTAAELKSAQADVRAMPWNDAAKDAFHLIRREIRGQGIIVGDRRLKKSVAACQASAYLHGNVEVTVEDLEILSHVLWVDPAEQPTVVNQVVCKIAAPAAMELNAYLAEAEQIFSEPRKEIMQKAGASKKLDEILRKVKALKGDRAKEVLDHIEGIQREVKKEILGAI